MSSSRTSGPWRWEDNKNVAGNRSRLTGRGRFRLSGPTKTVCEIYQWETDPSDHDRRLIATSPELLTVAKAVLRELEATNQSKMLELFLTNGLGELVVVSQLREVIAKAEGTE